jgi:hypothetical protein
MKSLWLVILLALLGAISAGTQEAVDQEIVIMGSDETFPEIPSPRLLDEIDIPPLDLTRPDIPVLPQVIPPWSDSLQPEGEGTSPQIPSPPAPSEPEH